MTSHATTGTLEVFVLVLCQVQWYQTMDYMTVHPRPTSNQGPRQEERRSNRNVENETTYK
jgi:hypothetical protein